jgi:hypothetical protein
MTYYEEDSPEFEEWKSGIIKNIESDNNHKEMMEMLGGIFVQLSRIYDVLITDSPNQADLDDRHSAGGLFASPPTLEKDAWNETVQNSN